MLWAQLYKSSYGYDANGNILNAERWDQFQTRYDSLTYKYQTVDGQRTRNRLYHLRDAAPDNVVDPVTDLVTDLALDQTTYQHTPATVLNTANNYGYDVLGNLTRDTREQIAQIDWTVAGKVKSVTRTAGSTLAALTFGYGAHGHRIWKKNLQTGNTTFYIHDAQGNLMATYEAKPAMNSLALSERPIYGSDRLGMDMNKIELYGLPDIRFTNLPTNGPAGLRRYEIKDHLGNVCVTTTGDRYGVDQTPPDGIIDYTMPKVVSWSGYEPFGCLLPGRNYSSGSYRFGFQGQEKDNELNGSIGTNYAFEYRMHDPRVGRFLSIDPLAAKYPHNSPYGFSENRVVDGIDLEGSEWKSQHKWSDKITNEEHIKLIGSGYVEGMTYQQAWGLMAPQLLQAKEGQVYDCANLSITVMVEFAYTFELPVYVKDYKGQDTDPTFDNDSYGYTDKKGTWVAFKEGQWTRLADNIAAHYGAADLYNNTNLTTEKDFDDLAPGDLVGLKYPSGPYHSQTVHSVAKNVDTPGGIENGDWTWGPDHDEYTTIQGSLMDDRTTGTPAARKTYDVDYITGGAGHGADAKAMQWNTSNFDEHK